MARVETPAERAESARELYIRKLFFEAESLTATDYPVSPNRLDKPASVGKLLDDLLPLKSPMGNYVSLITCHYLAECVPGPGLMPHQLGLIPFTLRNVPRAHRDALLSIHLHVVPPEYKTFMCLEFLLEYPDLGPDLIKNGWNPEDAYIPGDRLSLSTVMWKFPLQPDYVARAIDSLCNLGVRIRSMYLLPQHPSIVPMFKTEVENALRRNGLPPVIIGHSYEDPPYTDDELITRLYELTGVAHTADTLYSADEQFDPNVIIMILQYSGFIHPSMRDGVERMRQAEYGWTPRPLTADEIHRDEDIKSKCLGMRKKWFDSKFNAHDMFVEVAQAVEADRQKWKRERLIDDDERTVVPYRQREEEKERDPSKYKRRSM